MLKNVSVFSVGNDYHIMMPACGTTLMTVLVGDTLYGDESNGVLRSNVKIHRVIVPAKELNKAGEYTVFEQVVVDRKPYFPVLGEKHSKMFKFYPVPEDGEIRAYHISDAHNRIEEPVKAAKFFGKIDFLVLNGDIPNHCGSEENFDTVFAICSQITGGEIPIVFSRGNHDMRGILAERIADFTPNQNGNSYYSFRIGSVWGLVLDCGEDKEDDHPEYGGTVWCGNFRRRQTEYIKEIIENCKNEYAAEGVKHRLVIVHNPFPCIHRMAPPFENECELYAEWTSLIGNNIKPDVMLGGHYHYLEVAHNGDNSKDGFLPFSVVFGSEPFEDGFAGCGITLGEEKIKITFTDSRKGIIREEVV